MDAANKMVDMKGGSGALGMNGFLLAIVDTLTCALGRRDPMCKPPVPKASQWLPSIDLKYSL